MQDYRKLSVWEKAHVLTVAIYQVTANFPKDELFGLTSQIRRASVSIPANIAEGCGREGTGVGAKGGRGAFGSADGTAEIRRARRTKGPVCSLRSSRLCGSKPVSLPPVALNTLSVSAIELDPPRGLA